MMGNNGRAGFRDFELALDELPVLFMDCGGSCWHENLFAGFGCRGYGYVNVVVHNQVRVCHRWLPRSVNLIIGPTAGELRGIRHGVVGGEEYEPAFLLRIEDVALMISGSIAGLVSPARAHSTIKGMTLSTMVPNWKSRKTILSRAIDDRFRDHDDGFPLE